MVGHRPRIKPVRLTRPEAQIVYSVLSVVLNDPDWWDGSLYTPTDQRHADLAAAKVIVALNGEAS